MKDLTKLLEQLSIKLGTSVELLWSVLLKQAQINIYSMTFFVFILIISVIINIKLHLRFIKEDEDERSEYYKKEEIIIIPMIIFSLLNFICLIIFIIEIPNFITCILNPEYWALNKILKSIM